MIQFRQHIYNVSFVNHKDEITVIWGFTNIPILSRLVVEESGSVQPLTWHEKGGRWDVFCSSPDERCGSCGRCWAYGNCNRYNVDDVECACLPGLQPNSPDERYLGDGSNGCIRKNQTVICKNGEGLIVKVANVKVPDTSIDHVETNLDMKTCPEECLRNCSCTAYASVGVTEGSGRLTWYGELLDTRTFIFCDDWIGRFFFSSFWFVDAH